MLIRHKYTRLRGYDYSLGGAYFVTMNSYDRQHLFGCVISGPDGAYMELNECGLIVQRCWDSIPAHFPQVHLDAFQIMPDHLHGIIVIGDMAEQSGSADPLGSVDPLGYTDPFGSRHAST